MDITKIRHKNLIDETIIRLKERYPDMDAFLSLDYNSKFDLISKVIDTHEASMIEYAKLGVDIQLPGIGRLAIKQGKLVYNEVLKEYKEDNNIESNKDLTNDNKDDIASIMRDRMLQRKLQNKQIINEIRVLTFKMK